MTPVVPARRWAGKYLPPILALAVLGLLPAFGLGPNAIRLLFITFIWVTTSIAWNILGGYAGQVSFGFAVFYGVGAYTAAILINAGVIPYLAYAGCAALAVIASLIVGLPAFRLRGPYFAIATIGVSEAVRVVATNLGFTGGASGYRITEQRPFVQAEHYYTALVLAAGATAIAYAISRAKFGMGLMAISQDEDAAADVGINPFVYKLEAHALAAALTGVAGGVFARYAAFIHPNGVFGFHTGVQILLMPVIGGLGTVWGPVIGGGVIGIVEEQIVASFPQVHLLLYGSLLIIIVLLEPGGILGAFHQLIRRIRERSRRRTAAAAGEPPDKVLWGISGDQGREL